MRDEELVLSVICAFFECSSLVVVSTVCARFFSSVVGCSVPVCLALVTSYITTGRSGFCVRKSGCVVERVWRTYHEDHAEINNQWTTSSDWNANAGYPLQLHPSLQKKAESASSCITTYNYHRTPRMKSAILLKSILIGARSLLTSLTLSLAMSSSCGFSWCWRPMLVTAGMGVGGGLGLGGYEGG